jgi:hypothetical protein
MHAGPSLLANNPNHREEILKLMGGSAGNTFGHVARWLLQPAQSVQATVARTRKAVDSKGQGLPWNLLIHPTQDLTDTQGQLSIVYCWDLHPLVSGYLDMSHWRT